MQKSVDQWVADLREVELPVLARTITELGPLARRGATLTADRLASSIYRDPLMTFNVLRVANNRRSSRFASEITTVEHGIMMLGIPPFFSRFKKLQSVEQTLVNSPSALTALQRILCRAHHGAYQAWDWAILRKDARAEEIFIATLFLSLAELILWLFAPAQALERLRLLRAGMETPEADRQVLGFELRELHLALAEAWHLPDMYADFLRDENAARPQVRDALLADSIGRHAEHGWYGDAILQDIDSVANLLHMDSGDVAARIHGTAVAAAQHWDWYGVAPAATWLPLLPGPWPKEPGDGGEASPKQVCLVPQPRLTRQVMDEVEAHLDGTFNLQQLMALVLRGMRDGIGLDRVVFGLVTPDRSKVTLKFIRGAEPDAPLHDFEFSLDGKNLFAKLMGKMQGVWYGTANRKVLDPLITPEIRHLVGDGEFFAMSLHVHDKPVGLFYADRKHGACKLDENSYSEFKQLCLRAAQGLGNLAKT
jgi:HD-like signal output (HDOD) protein